MAITTFTNIDEYIALQEDKYRPRLQEIREFIHSVVPEAVEKISYQICCFELDGLLVGFGAIKNHCSFYLCSGDVGSQFAEELKEFKGTKSAVHLKLELPLPKELLMRIILARVEQNRMKALSKKCKSK